MGAMTEKYAEINRLLDDAEAGLVETGLYDAQTARALFAGIRPPGTDNVVGNLADLQRQPLMPPGFEQGAMDGANPGPVLGPVAEAPALPRTSAEKLADYGVELPETPATSAEAVERAAAPSGGGPTVIDDSDGSASGTSAESPQNGSLDSMTKADLQSYADSNGISGVDQSTQTKDEMLATIRGQ